MNKNYLAVVMMTGLLGCSSQEDASSNSTAPIATVTLATATLGNIQQTSTIYGEVMAGTGNQIVLTAPMESVVTSIAAPAGTAVTAGSPVVHLRASALSASQYQAAAADAVASHAALARTQRLRADGLAGDGEVEAAQAHDQAASALLAAFKQRNAQLTLKATQTGSVDTIGANVGDLVQAGSMLATLSRSSTLIAKFGLDLGMARTLRPGDTIEIHPADGAPAFFTSITSISLTPNSQTRLASVLAEIPASQRLPQGQPLSARITAQQAHAAITIPIAALLDDGGQPYVFVVRNHIAQRRDVQLGANDNQRQSILSGIKAGDAVVVTGAAALDDGMQVRTP